MMLMVLLIMKRRFWRLLQLKEREGQQRELSSHVPGIWITGILFFVAVACVEGSQSSVISPLPHDLSSPEDKAIQSVSVGEPPKGMEAVMQSSNHRYRFLLPIILASVAGLAVILLVICIYLFWKRRGRRSCNAPLSKDIENSVTSKGLLLEPIFNRFSLSKVTSNKEELNMLDYATLVSATEDFSEKNILGQGGFSSVYRACFSGGNYVAVKKLDGTGLDFEIEFENELDLLSSIAHQNIVSLLGYCINVEQRFLVYELLQNGSLETQLHGPSHGSALTWHIRMKIALDIARGLEYLHEHCSPSIIHRDIKSSNILLDTDFNAKISDFGLAVTGGNHNNDTMKLSGTIGYVAPEYLLDGKLTEKSDVYAFGVVLLELLLGRKPVEKISPSQCQSIVTWAMPQLTDRTKLPNIVDPVIRNSMDPKHLYQVAAVTVLCVQPEPSYRPLITDVLHSLIPLVPVELGGTLRLVEASSCLNQKNSTH